MVKGRGGGNDTCVQILNSLIFHMKIQNSGLLILCDWLINCYQGKAKYKASENAIVWKIKRMGGMKEQTHLVFFL